MVIKITHTISQPVVDGDSITRLIKVPGTLRFQKIVILDSLKITNISNIEIMYLI